MKILVYDIPAKFGGALTVLKEAYAYACERTDIEWVFVINPKVVCLNIFEQKKHIRIEVAKKAEKSWFHRMFYDHVTLGKLVSEEKPDLIISLANVTVPVFHVKQFVYMHNLIPFCDLKFSLLKHRTLWFYKHVIARTIYFGVRRCDRVIVQTKWVRNAVMKKCGINEEKFIICPPKIAESSFLKYQDSDEARKCFFYPAGMSEFKNHITVVKAVEELSEHGVTDFSVLFTGNTDICEIEGKPLKGLPVSMVGYMQYGDVLKQYAKSVLVFPSVLETFGLPLLEARLSGSVIIAGNTDFAHEVLNGYENALFFDAKDSHALAECMQLVMNGDFRYEPNPAAFELQGGWDDVVAQMK